MATQYYQVSPLADHPIGTVIQPGRAGQQYRRFVKGVAPGPSQDLMSGLVWEAVLEAARLAIDPSLPSRLNCVFGFKTKEAAVAFRDRHRPPGTPIFKIEAVSGSPVFAGDLDLITSTAAGAIVDIWSQGAVKYWRDQPAGVSEVLIGGPVTIVEKA